MGCCGGNATEDKKASKDIDAKLKRDEKAARNEIKLLLLGAGESGKSTILKQMQIIHGRGFGDDTDSYKEIIFSNTVQSMRVLVEAMERLEVPYNDTDMKTSAQVILDQPNQIEAEVFPPPVADAVKKLWADSGIQVCYARSNEYQLNDSAKYYFDSIDRISAEDFKPTDQDVLRSRVKTTGITETKFLIQDLVYRMFDVGGQRSERKKWIHCFENVTAIIFLIAISAYDQVLVEDETVNRMHESLTLFDSICNSKWFVKTSIVLFLNKIDVFKEKIAVSRIDKYFPEYMGGPDYDAGTKYFTDKFVSLNQSDVKSVYPHLTCATDTKMIQFVMAAVNDIIIQNNLRDCGLL